MLDKDIAESKYITVEKEGIVVQVPLCLFDMGFEEAENFAQIAGCFGLLRIFSKVNEFNEKHNQGEFDGIARGEEVLK